MLKKIKCPCCGYCTIDPRDEVIVDICKICFWQYDWVAHEKPDRVIGPNGVSLNEARENYKKYGISEPKYLEKGLTRKPTEDDICSENADKEIK